MADDIILPSPTTTGKTVRAYDDGAREWPVGLVAYPTGGASGSYTFQVVDLTHGLPNLLTAGEAHVGEVGAKSDLLDLTFSLDTSAYASGDLLADSQAILNAVRVTGGTGVLQDILLVDEDDQGVAMTLYFFDSNVSMGTENAAPSITDANARTCLGYVDVASSDWRDLGGVRVASIRNVGLVLKPSSGTSVYVAVVNGTSAPTFTASGLKGRFKVLQD